MLYHYAITPEVFEPWAINEMTPAGIVLIELLRGMCDNGLLADLDAGQWMTQIRRHQRHADIPPAVRDRIENCLGVLHNRNRLIRHPAGCKAFEGDEFRWLHWSIERHRASPLSAVFSSDELIELSELEGDILFRLSAALGADCWTERRHSVSFTKIESNLRRHLAPVLAYAQKVTLIDPYMTCREDRFFNTVQATADLLGRRDGTQSPGEIRIHAGNPAKIGPDEHREPNDARLNRWKRELGPVARQYGHSFRVLLWGKRPDGPNFHDRYIITDQCGLKAPGGLDFLPDTDEERANVTEWGALGADEIRAIIHKRFHHQKSKYRYLGSTDVMP